MGCSRAWVAVVTLGTAGTAAAQSPARSSSASFPPASASAPTSAAAPSGPPAAPAPATSSVPAAPSAVPPPGGAPAPPPGYAPYPYPYPYAYPPYPYPYYYPWPPPDASPPKDTRPRTLPYEEGKPPPPGYHVETGVQRGPVIAGSLMFGITYGLQVFVASIAAGYGNDTDWLYVPVLGSWVYMGEECNRGSDDGCSFLVLHGLTQTSGAALLVYGIVSKRKRYVRDEVGVRVLPGRIGSGYGFSAVGRF